MPTYVHLFDHKVGFYPSLNVADNRSTEPDVLVMRAFFNRTEDLVDETFIQ